MGVHYGYRPTGNGAYIPPIPPLVTSSLVLRYDAANSTSYPGSGSTWFDLVGTNHVSISNASYVSESIPYFNFNGSSSYMIRSPANNVISGNNVATIIAWIYPNTSQPDSTYSGIFALGSKACNGQTLLFSMTSGRTLTMAKWCDDSTNGTSTPPALTWSMVSLVKDGASTRFGVNSTFANSSNTGTANFGGTILTIGSTDTPGRYYSGRIASILLYNRALSDAEVTQNYQATRNNYGV